MSEGELKKRLRGESISDEYGHLTIDQDELDKVLVEAKKEYLELEAKWLKKYPEGLGDYHGDVLAQWREHWFKKWFGEDATR